MSTKALSTLPPAAIRTVEPSAPLAQVVIDVVLLDGKMLARASFHPPLSGEHSALVQRAQAILVEAILALDTRAATDTDTDGEG
jgi:hypothetical protein